MTSIRLITHSIPAFAVLLLLWIPGAAANEADQASVPHPDWFKSSFLDLRVDLAEARAAGKAGLLLFFHTPSCSYCKALLKTTFADASVARRLNAEFDVVALDVLGDVEVTDFDGRGHWASQFAVHEKAHFTPTLVFYGTDGKRLLRLAGYHPPERFHAVLDYLEQGRHASQSLRDFLAERKSAPAAERRSAAPRDPLFARPSYILDRRLAPSDRPLFVLFEGGDCPSCERLHELLRQPELRDLLGRYEAVRLDMNDSETRLVTPAGDRFNAREWADALGLLHAPALLFFDESGKEVLRTDSELFVDASGAAIEDSTEKFAGNLAARFRYVLAKDYRSHPQFQQWRLRQAAGSP